jgi:hypothetical protein
LDILRLNHGREQPDARISGILPSENGRLATNEILLSGVRMNIETVDKTNTATRELLGAKINCVKKDVAALGKSYNAI